MGGKILYKFASRNRPTKFFSTLDNIQNLSISKNYKIICSLDNDDDLMAEAIDKNKKMYSNVRVVWGNSTSKVEAINADMNTSGSWDVCVVVSDDMVFLKKGFDNIIRSDMRKYFPDTDGVLHYPDGTPASDRLITMSIIGRAYYERFGYLYHPAYSSLWCDNEFTDVAKVLNKYKFINNQIFAHFHPAWGAWKGDNLHTRNEAFYKKDFTIYQARKLKKFK